MRVKITFTDTDGREPMELSGIIAVHQHGRNGTALLETEARELEMENIKCLHSYEGDE